MFRFFSKTKQINSQKSDFTTAKEREDLTDLKRYIEEFLKFLPLPVCWVNPLGVVVDANRAFYNLTGYKREGDYSGETILRIEILFEDKKKWRGLEKRILQRELIDGEEIILINQTGRRISVSLWGSYRESPTGQLIGYFLAFSDITAVKELRENLEHKVQERTEELEEEREKNLAIVLSLIDGLLVFDEYSQLSLMNSQAEKFLGVNGKKIYGKKIFELNPYKNFRPLVSFLGNQLQEIFRQDVQIKENLILEVSTIPLISKNQLRIGTVVVLHDITREKLVEKMKSEFVTVAAHQLRTPTSAIKWSLKMLVDGDLGDLSLNQKEIIEKTYNTNEKVIHLIRDLLNVARIEEGKFLTKVILSNIEDVIQSVVAEYQEDIKKKKLNFELKKSDEEPPKVMLDFDKMKIAVGNLIDNAIRYTLPNGKIAVSIIKREEELEVQIKDSGVGIPENQQDKVFTKFFRGDNIITIETEGTGLGLFITKSIIEAHGGRIWFESEGRRGTTFCFSIPLKEKFAEYLTEEFY